MTYTNIAYIYSDKGNSFLGTAAFPIYESTNYSYYYSVVINVGNYVKVWMSTDDFAKLTLTRYLNLEILGE